MSKWIHRKNIKKTKTIRTTENDGKAKCTRLKLERIVCRQNTDISPFLVIDSNEKRNAFDILNDCQFFIATSRAESKNARNVSAKYAVVAHISLYLDSFIIETEK